MLLLLLLRVCVLKTLHNTSLTHTHACTRMHTHTRTVTYMHAYSWAHTHTRVHTPHYLTSFILPHAVTWYAVTCAAKLQRLGKSLSHL